MLHITTEERAAGPRRRIRSAVALAVALSSAVALAGCAVGGATSSNSKNITLTGEVWGDWSFVFDAAKSYHAANPNVTVKLTAIPNADYFNKIPQLFASGGGSDFTVVPRDSAYYPRYVGQKILAPLDDVWASSGLDANAIDSVKTTYTSSDGHKYAISAGATVVPVMYYNVADFEKAGIATPSQSGMSLDEFATISAKLVKAGFSPLAAGFGEGGQAPFRMFGPYIREMCGSSWIAKLQGKTPDPSIWADSCIAKSLAVPEAWAKNGTFASGTGSATTTEAVALSIFESGKASMAIDGTWAAAGIAAAAPSMKVGWFLPPSASTATPPKAIFSTIDALAVNAKSAHVTEAKNFLSYLAKQKSIWSHGIAPRTDLTPPADTNAVVKGVYEISKSSGTVDDLVQSAPTSVYNAYNSAAQAVIAGTKSPTEAAKDVAQAALAS